MTLVHPTVRVLLSVHRGERFIGAQLASLLAQERVAVRLGFHLDSDDDGSECQITGAFPDAQRLDHAPGLGLPQAYLALMSRFDDDSDAFAFCDQDDVWNPRKLTTALQALAGFGSVPALWVCRVEPFSASGVPRRLAAASRPGSRPSLANALVQTIGPGCAMVWNPALHRILVDHAPSQGVLMHDSWVYLVAATFGSVVVEPHPLVRYRLHTSNAVGLSRGPVARVRRLMRVPSGQLPTIASQAEEFGRVFGPDLADDDRIVVDALAHWDRPQLARAWVRGGVRRSTVLDQALLLPRLMAPRRFSGADPHR